MGQGVCENVSQSVSDAIKARIPQTGALAQGQLGPGKGPTPCDSISPGECLLDRKDKTSKRKERDREQGQEEDT